jgi:hypothetical protein
MASSGKTIPYQEAIIFAHRAEAAARGAAVARATTCVEVMKLQASARMMRSFAIVSAKRNHF